MAASLSGGGAAGSTATREPPFRESAHSEAAMFRQAISLAILTFLFSGVVLRAEDGTAAAQGGGFKPIWTAVGAGAGFGLGVWAGLSKFDQSINSDSKVWTTAIVCAAAGGVIGFVVDRRQARAHPSAVTQPLTADPSSWRQAVYGSTTASPSLRLPTVATLTGLDAATGR